MCHLPVIDAVVSMAFFLQLMLYIHQMFYPKKEMS
jgi:hypothetical protein